MTDNIKPKIDKGFESQWELMCDVFAMTDYRLYLAYKYHQWIGPQNNLKNMLGLVVSREEFEHNLHKAAEHGIRERLEPDERTRLFDVEFIIKKRLEKTGPLPLTLLFERFALDEFERRCIELAYACELDPKYEKLVAFLQDDMTKKRPGYAFAVRLFLPEGETIDGVMPRFNSRSGFTSLLMDNGTLSLNPDVLGFLASGVPNLPAGLELFDGKTDSPEGPLVIGQNTAKELDYGFGAVFLTGAAGSGKSFQLKHLFRRKSACGLFADMQVLGLTPESVRRVDFIARMMGAIPVFTHFDPKDSDSSPESIPPVVINELGRIQSDRFYVLSKQSLGIQLSRTSFEISIPPLSMSESLSLLSNYLDGISYDFNLREVAAKFKLEPGDYKKAVLRAKDLMEANGETTMTPDVFYRSVQNQLVHRLDYLATKIKPQYSWDDVVLPSVSKKLLRQACAHVKYAHNVYTEWGFERKVSYGQGLSVLFAGAPGTGKTMCAQVMAKELGMEIYKINISKIVSKYIGETEKNLQAVFNEAKRASCILFFDECDALFGKRSDVKDAHDRHANVEVAYLLQQIEEYDGVCLLATNLSQNIDTAFMRRITYVVHFPFPDAITRETIFKQMIPKEAPVSDDIDWAFLAEKFPLSGGHVKNIVISAAFMAAAGGQAISMSHLMTAAVGELRKNEIVVVREAFGEYADLIDEE